MFAAVETIIGMTACFHVFFTAEMLMTSQDDFKEHGKLFSASVIICCNVILLTFFVIIISRNLKVENYSTFAKKSMVSICKRVQQVIK